MLHDIGSEHNRGTSFWLSTPMSRVRASPHTPGGAPIVQHPTAEHYSDRCSRQDPRRLSLNEVSCVAAHGILNRGLFVVTPSKLPPMQLPHLLLDQESLTLKQLSSDVKLQPVAAAGQRTTILKIEGHIFTPALLLLFPDDGA
jgi:hypothetical protein